MPHGERWLSAHLEDLGVPVGVNLGASIDFAAGRIDRAPRWMQKSGLEWAFRLMLEPGRLFSRYARNARFILGMTLRGPGRSAGRRGAPPSATARRQARLSEGNPDDHLADSLSRQLRGRRDRPAGLLPAGVRGRPEHDDRSAHVRDDPPAVRADDPRQLFPDRDGRHARRGPARAGPRGDAPGRDRRAAGDHDHRRRAGRHRHGLQQQPDRRPAQRPVRPSASGRQPERSWPSRPAGSRSTS